MEQQLDKEIRERLRMSNNNEILSLYPSVKSKLEARFVEADQKSREANIRMLQDSYDAKNLVLAPS